ncbi:MAG: Gfo/Idh/MocA family oxidoreductase [Armatimonadetes bacterium]|nr:Gfo/Idh/MocA family oxidoreductase [Armatimonadota bacterium]
MAESLSIGLVGCGNWGRHILRDLRALGCRVSVVARSDASRANAAEHGGDVVGSLAELPDVAGAVVCTPSVTHAEVVEALLPRGVPILVEKSLTTDVASARRLVAEAGDRVFVMHKWRFHPGIEALGEIAASGTLGAPRGMRLSHLGWGRPHLDVDPVWILLPHCLSILLAVFGRIPAPLAAVADRAADPGWADGLAALLGPPPWAAVEVSSRFAGHRREFQLVCEEGTASLGEAWTREVDVQRVGAEPEKRLVSDELPLYRELREFAEYLRGGPPPRCSAAEGLLVVEGVAALRELAGLPGSCPPPRGGA